MPETSVLPSTSANPPPVRPAADLAFFAPPPLIEGEDTGAYDDLLARISGAIKPSDILEEIWVRVRRLNQYVQDEQPWQIAKEEGAEARLDSVLYGLAEGLRVVSLLLHPYMPNTTTRLLEAHRAIAGLLAPHGGGRAREAQYRNSWRPEY